MVFLMSLLIITYCSEDECCGAQWNDTSVCVDGGGGGGGGGGDMMDQEGRMPLERNDSLRSQDGEDDDDFDEI